MRGTVEQLLGDLNDPARVAERLRADPALTAAEIRAALRVLLESSRPSA
jgi:uncharacterized protein (DUF433 family)